FGGGRSVAGVRAGAGPDGAAVGGRAHGAARAGCGAVLLDLACAVHPFGNEGHHRVRRRGIEFSAVGAAQAGDVARELDDGQLHAQADAQVGHAVFTRIADGGDLAFGAALAEAAGHQNGVQVLELVGATGFDVFGIDVLDVDLRTRVD